MHIEKNMTTNIHMVLIDSVTWQISNSAASDQGVMEHTNGSGSLER